MLKWFDSLQRQFFGLIAIGFVIWFVVPIAYQTSYCGPSEYTQQHSTSEKSAPQEAQKAVASRDEEQADAAYGSAKYKPQPVSWLCDARLTDIALVLFTYCLVIVGWAGIKSSEQTVRTLERAYIFLAMDHEKLADRIWKAELQISNSGRTPGVVLEHYVRFSASEPEGNHPEYKPEGAFTSKEDAVIPSGKRPKFHDVTIDIVSNPYLIGFFRYEDIWRVEHTSRFCLCYDYLNQGFDRAGPDAWNAWD